MTLTFQDPTRPSAPVTGTTRWNTSINHMEVFDGASWQILGVAEAAQETMANCVQILEDQIAVRIEEEYQDNATIQDAFKEWEAANERFKVILALSEKNK